MEELNFDRYTAVREIGRGGAAVVYEAVHQGLGTRHALKLLSVQSDAVRKRMINEARLQAQLKHPNLVAVTDVFEVDNRPVVILDLIDGPTLERWLIDEGLPEYDEAERIFRGIVAGVAAAHAKGVVHRDLKPANVLLEGDDLQPRVTDFGLAKALAVKSGETRMGVAMGTPGYMAPELIGHAATADERADIFSLGCILYAMVGGAIPFGADNVLASLNRTAEGDYVPLDELAHDAPPHLVSAVHACLQTSRDDRPASCADLLALLALPEAQPAAPRERAVSDPEPVSQPVPEHAPPAQPAEDEDDRPAPSMRRVVGAVLLLAGMALLAWMSDAFLQPEPQPPTTTLPGER
jgi:eukaryotic-like serine/threonine-protein kinase